MKKEVRSAGWRYKVDPIAQNEMYNGTLMRFSWPKVLRQSFPFYVNEKMFIRKNKKLRHTDRDKIVQFISKKLYKGNFEYSRVSFIFEYSKS